MPDPFATDPWGAFMPSRFDLREEEREKGSGFFGPLQRPDGSVSSELSFDFDVDGRKIKAPLLVPGLSRDEIDLLLSGGDIPDSIYQKAQEHALKRVSAGRSAFAEEGEQRPPIDLGLTPGKVDVGPDPWDALIPDRGVSEAILAARKRRVEELKLSQRQGEDFEKLQTHGFFGPAIAGVVDPLAWLSETAARRSAFGSEIPGAMTPEAQAAHPKAMELAEAMKEETAKHLSDAASRREFAAAADVSDPNFFQRQLRMMPSLATFVGATALNPALGAAVGSSQMAGPSFAGAVERGVSPSRAEQEAQIPGTVGALLAVPGFRMLGSAAGPIKQAMLPGFIKHTIRSAAEVGAMGTAIEAANIAAEANTGKEFTWEEIRSRLAASTTEFAGIGTLFGALGARGAVRRGNEQFARLERFVDDLNAGVVRDEAITRDLLRQKRAGEEEAVLGQAARASRAAESARADRASERLDAIAREAGVEPPNPLARLEVIKQELGVTERTPVERLRDESLAILEAAGEKIQNEDPFVSIERIAGRLGIPDVGIERRLQLIRQELGLGATPTERLAGRSLRIADEAQRKLTPPGEATTLAPDAAPPAEPAPAAAGPAAPVVGGVPRVGAEPGGGGVAPGGGAGERAVLREGGRLPGPVQTDPATGRTRIGQFAASEDGVPLPPVGGGLFRGQRVGDTLDPTEAHRSGPVGAVPVTTDLSFARSFYLRGKTPGEGRELIELAATLKNPYSYEHAYGLDRLSAISQKAAERARAAGLADAQGRVSGWEFVRQLHEAFLEENPNLDRTARESFQLAFHDAQQKLLDAGFDSTFQMHEVEGGGFSPEWGLIKPRMGPGGKKLAPARVLRQIEPGPATGQVGRSGVLSVEGFPDGVRFRWRLRRASDLRTSHDDAGNPDPTYPASRQPRQRDRISSEQQIEKIATDPDVLRLGESPTATNGAPLVGADAVVDAGNGRANGLRRMYARGGAGAEKYRRWVVEEAERLGLDPKEAEGMPDPVLVRELDPGMTPEARDRFASASNVPEQMARSRPELALEDARRIPDAALELLPPDFSGDVNTPGARPFVRDFIDSLPESERAGVADRNGNLSQDGVRRIQAALFARAFDDATLIERTLESTDDNARRAGAALLTVAPTWAKLRSLVRAGALHDADITPDLTSAIVKMQDLRREGTSVETYLAQQGLFGSELTPESRVILEKLLSGKVGRSKDRMAAWLITYAEGLQAEGSPKQVGMFGGGGPTKMELIEAAFKRYDEGINRQQGLFGGEPIEGAEPAPLEPVPPAKEPAAPVEEPAPVSPDRVAWRDFARTELGVELPEKVGKQQARQLLGQLVSNHRFTLTREGGVWYAEWTKDPTKPDDKLFFTDLVLEAKEGESVAKAKLRLVREAGAALARGESLPVPTGAASARFRFEPSQGPLAGSRGTTTEGPLTGKTETGRFRMALPELVEIAEQILNGKLPQVKRALGNAFGLYAPGPHKIKLLASIFQDSKQAAAVLAHEIGHAIDALPDYAIHGRGNILGRIATLHDYLKTMLPEKQGGPENWITDAERAKKIKQIEKQLLGKGRPKKGSKRYDEWMANRKAMEDQIAAEYNDWLAAEAERRGMLEWGQISRELHEVSRAWRPDLWASDSERMRQYRESSVELFADSFSMLLNDPDRLARMAPKYYAAVMEYIFAGSRGPLNERAGQTNRKPEVAAIYDELTGRGAQGMEALEARREERVKTMIAEGTERLAGALVSKERPPISAMDQFKQNFVEVAHFLYKGTNVARKKFGKGSRVYQMGETAIRRFEEYVLGNSALFAMVDEVGERVLRPMREAGVTMDELSAMMFYRRIAATEGGRANPLGIDAEAAGGLLRRMEQRMAPEQWRAVQEAADTYWNVVREPLLRDLEDAGPLSPDVVKKLSDNRHYTRFAVLRYLEQHPVLSQASGLSALKARVGTFNKIADPFVATLLTDMALRRLVDRTRAVRSTAEFAIQMGEGKPAPKMFNGRFMVPKPPKKGSGEALVTWMQDGKVQGAYLPEAYAKMFERMPDQGEALRVFNKYGMQWIRKSFVTHNPLFTIWNFQRDLRAFLKYVPSGAIGSGTSLKRAKALATSYRDVGGRAMKELWYAWSDVLNPKMRDDIRLLADELEMLKTRALYAPGRAVWEAHHAGPEAAFEMLQERIGVSDGAYREMVRKPMARFMHAIGKTLSLSNEITERAMKVAGWRYLRSAFPEMPTAEVARMVRNRIGTPNTQRRGLKYNLYNNLWMFSNVAKEGWRQSWESLREDPTSFTAKAIIYDIAPALAAAAAARGALNWVIGDRAEEWWGAVDENDKALYTIIPLGWSADDKPVYMRLPHDHFGQFVHAVAWKIGAETADPAGLFEIAMAQLPWGEGNLNPLVDAARYPLTYAQGVNPRDAFRQREILTRAEFKEGGAQAWAKVGKASLNEFSPYRFSSTEYEGVLSELEQQLQIPGWGNLLRRFVKVSDYGRYQQARKITKGIQREHGRNERLRDEAIIEALKENRRIGPRSLWNQLHARGVPTHKEYGDFLRRVEEHRTRLYGTHQQKLISLGGSKEEKEAIEEWLEE